jgi:integrase
MPDDMKSIVHIALHMNKAIECLSSGLDNTNNTNMHGYYSAIIAFVEYNTSLRSLINKHILDKIYEQWCIQRKTNEIPIVQRRLLNKPSETQEKKGGSSLKFSDIVAKRDSLEYASPERLLLGFYTYLPPVRADYFAVEIIKHNQRPTEQNYIRLITPTHSKCILRDFKTKKAYNKIENTLPHELDMELRESLKNNPRPYLFMNANGEPFTRNAFCIWSKRLLSRLFKTEVTLVMFRHAFITTLDFNNTTDQDLKELGNKMGHSLATQRTYRWVNTEGEIKEETAIDFEESSEEEPEDEAE